METNPRNPSLAALLLARTNEEIAAACGVGGSTAARWRNGHAFPRAAHVPGLAGLLGVPEHVVSEAILQGRRARRGAA